MAQRQRVESALMDRMNPFLDRDQNMLEQKLANQGLAPGGEAYKNAMMDQSNRVNDARLGVIGQGTQEMQATQQMANAARDQAMNERTGLMQQSGSGGVPSYQASGQVNAPAYSGQGGQGMGLNNPQQLFQNYSDTLRNERTAENNQRAASANQMGNAGAGFGDALTKALMNSNKFKGLF